MYSREDIRRLSKTSLSDYILQQANLTEFRDNVFFTNFCNKKTIEFSTEITDIKNPEGLVMYPNPFANELTINLSENS